MQAATEGIFVSLADPKQLHLRLAVSSTAPREAQARVRGHLRYDWETETNANEFKEVEETSTNADWVDALE